MRRSSQIGFTASIGLAIFSASLVGDVATEQNWSLFWPEASAGISTQANQIPHPSDITGEWAHGQGLPNDIRRRHLFARVHHKLSRGSEAVDAILR
jgi:hypothetical protein